jgi:hypothetical protein
MRSHCCSPPMQAEIMRMSAASCLITSAYIGGSSPFFTEVFGRSLRLRFSYSNHSQRSQTWIESLDVNV